MSDFVESITRQLSERENELNAQIQKAQQDAADQKAASMKTGAELASEKAKTKVLSKRVMDLQDENTSLQTQIAKLEKEMTRILGQIRATNYEVYQRGEFAMSASVAEFPKATKASAVGGTQTGTADGAIKRGDKWIVTNANGRRFTGMTANFAFGVAEVIAKEDDPGNDVTKWAIEAVDFAQTVANQNPVVQLGTPTSSNSFQVNTPVTIPYTASDPEGQGLTAKLLINDVEQTLTPSGSAFTWTPTAPGTYAVKVRVTDTAGGVATSGAANVTIVAAPSTTRTLVDQIDFRHNDTYTGTSADNSTFDSIAHKFFGTDSSFAERIPANWSRGTLFYNSDPFTGDINDADGTFANGSARHTAYKDFAYNIRTLTRSGLVAGNYELEVYVLRLWNNGVSTLTVNGVNTNLSAPSGPYGIKQVIPVTVTTAGTIVITDKNTVDNPSGEGGINLSFLRLYKIG